MIPAGGILTIIRGACMRRSILTALLATAAIAGAAGQADAQMKPIAVGDGIALKPLFDARLREEHVDQTGIANKADAITARIRSGIELSTTSGFSVLAESEATLAISERYNSGTNLKTAFPVVADPQNIELNRLQVAYATKHVAITVGRQRINLDDQRFVGSVGWRDNEQTFDAVRLEAKQIGPFVADAIYTWSTRTIYGIEAQDLPPFAANKQAIDGNSYLGSLWTKVGPLTVKGFGYLIDQDELGRRQFSSQTYGVRAVAVIPIGAKVKLNLTGSFARQSNYASNPGNYSADYYLAEGGTTIAGFGLSGGYEVLGASTGAANTSFQTPLATLHKFNGTADKFLVTPANGLRDLYATVGHKFGGTAIPGLNAGVTYHRFRSDRADIAYGDEWDAQVAFKIRKVAALVKYASYSANRYATDTKKLWLELDFGL